MMVRRAIQSLLLLALCAFIAACLRAMYLVGVAVAAGVAISSGVLVTWGIAVAIVWPVLVLAYALHRFSGDGRKARGRAPEDHDRR